MLFIIMLRWILVSIVEGVVMESASQKLARLSSFGRSGDFRTLRLPISSAFFARGVNIVTGRVIGNRPYFCARRCREVSDQGNEMRFVLAVMAVLAGMSVIGVAQSQPNQFKVKTSKAVAEPKSTATVKAPTATTSSSTSKELRSVERETPKAGGAAHPAKTAPKTTAMKSSKSDKNPPMNFGGKGNGGGVGTTRQPSAYKGRVKQKGQGGHN